MRENERFHGLLEHVADMLESAVLRHVYGQIPGEGATVDKESIERGLLEELRPVPARAAS